MTILKNVIDNSFYILFLSNAVYVNFFLWMVFWSNVVFSKTPNVFMSQSSEIRKYFGFRCAYYTSKSITS